MTREDRKAIAALKKDMKKLIKPLLKPYGFKTVGGYVWKIEGDLLFRMVPLINTPINGDKAVLSVTYGVKPTFVDDLLWDVLGFEENKQAPASLRVNGAFTVQSVAFEKQQYTLNALEVEEFEAHLKDAMEHFSQTIAAAGPDGLSWFYGIEAKKERYWHSEVMRLMLLLHDGKRDEALEYVRQNQLRDFIVDGKSLGEKVAEYCL